MSTKEGLFELAMLNPSGVFKTPQDLMSVESLTFIEKKKILNSWKSECEKLIMAEGGGVESEDYDTLNLINQALDETLRKE